MTRFLFVLPLFCIACVTPESGDYLFEAVGEASGDCPDVPTDTGDDEEAETVGIRVADDGESFKYVGIECELDGTSFDCVLSETTTDLSEMGSMDAVITATSTMDGSWTASDYIVGSFNYIGTCDGAECDGAEEAGYWICESSSGFSAQKE